MSLSFAFVAMSQPPEPVENRLYQQIYLAKDDGRGNPGDETTEFVVTDIPIHCVVVLSNSESVTVKMDLVVVEAAGLRAETRIVSRSYTTRELQDTVQFFGKPRGNWLAGTYRADISIDGVLVGKFPFVIKAAGKPGVNARPKTPAETKRSRSAFARKT